MIDMSDVIEGVSFEGKNILSKSKTDSLRDRMKSFVADREEVELKTVREKVSTGRDVSEIVKNDREERF